ncbi:hypothetical protein EZ313_20300 [Ramlibacter henchirensis]|uniref:non-specific serine/threonine protein kinase n=1 Tax=Ramlibacter henchirensis TaxID=204072 RepID=A0A4Z0BRB8_9BURK|nr:ATPase domain-containing protein [Ramlibacter henchirensis]TFZ00788.1 hypothetical protein EZ313_20300 [Ramlibacter henchirensis]
MSSNAAATPPPLERISTGTPGLDEIMGGGLLKSGVYIFQGAPGAGKTILANQIVHRHAADGGKVVYVTLLAESHARLLQHMGAFAFFDPSVVPQKIYYVSAFNALRTEGLKGVVNLLRNEMRTRPAGLVVLDGLVMAASAARSDEELKLFVSDIQTHSTLSGCTTLLLTSEQADRPVSAEQTMVDGIVLLRETALGVRRERNIEVVKFRGSATLRGNHAFRIGPQGIVVYPRLESRRPAHGDAPAPEGVSTGVAALDRMFDIGGYAKGSVTALSGASGSGKTTLALHFLAPATPAEKALFVGFYESPQMLRRIAGMLGVRLPADASTLDFMWHTLGENMLDEVAANILERVARNRPARLVIDGVGGLMVAPAFQHRGGSFLAALTNELRALGTTTLVTVEQDDAKRALVLDSATMSALADTVLDMRLKMEPSVRRFISIRKSRVSRCELHERELVLTESGLAVAEEPTIGS